MATTAPKITAPSGSFGDKLGRALEARGFGARTLARLLSARNGGTVENRRRAIIRWLQGATPEPANRHLVEDALGMERDSLKGEEEDEDADLLNQLLTARIREIVRREMSRA